jgi:hypothetical protein
MPSDPSKPRTLTDAERATFSDTQRSAREAYTSLISRVSVMVFPRGLEDGTAGSGLLLITPSGTPFLLTARHLFEHMEDAPELALANESLAYSGAGGRVFLGPARPGPACPRDDGAFVDVAAVSLAPAIHAPLSGLAGATIAEESGAGEDDVVVIEGFPSFLTKGTRPRPDSVRFDVARIVYITGIEGRDACGRLRVLWHQAETLWDVPKIPHYPVPEREVFDLDGPFGISGGGVWRVRGAADKHEIWVPTKHCQLIGVPSGYLGRTEFAEPVELWRDWLRDAYGAIDAAALL